MVKVVINNNMEIEDLIIKKYIGDSDKLQKDIFGDDNLDTKFSNCCDSMFSFNINLILNNLQENIDFDFNVLSNWGNVIKPGIELSPFINTESAFNDEEYTNIYSAIYLLKFEPEIHKSIRFADNNLKIREYKLEAVEGDLFIFPSNIYKRIPTNTSEKNQIILNILFEKQ
jgi:hypothetical protein